MAAIIDGKQISKQIKDELKEKVQGSVESRDIRYNNSWHNAPGILSSIKLDEIGTLE